MESFNVAELESTEYEKGCRSLLLDQSLHSTALGCRKIHQGVVKLAYWQYVYLLKSSRKASRECLRASEPEEVEPMTCVYMLDQASW